MLRARHRLFLHMPRHALCTEFGPVVGPAAGPWGLSWLMFTLGQDNIGCWLAVIASPLPIGDQSILAWPVCPLATATSPEQIS